MELPKKIGILGVGYVGLPLTVCFAKKFSVVAYDLNSRRIEELNQGLDRTNEVESSELKSKNICFTSNLEDLKGLSVYIVTVPTPVDHFNTPDLNPLLSACDILSGVISKGATIVFESTVYPGLTEEILAPKLEELTGLKYNQDFFLGYSPERVNPGDKEHTVSKIKKIVAGSTPTVAEQLYQLYGAVIEAGIFKARNIATAEAAKVIENIQRDVNIGLINELTVLFDRLGLDIYDVLEASGTKWNFIKFKPGLVGGHCIGVDPFYLTYKAQEVGYHPEMILAGRRINDNMAQFYAEKFVKTLLKRKLSPIGGNVLVLGFTFKENCPDIRNTKVIDLVRSLQEFQLQVDIVDPVADAEGARHEYGVEIAKEISKGKKYAGIVLAVPHKEVLELTRRFEDFLIPGGLAMDIKGVLPASPIVVH